MWNFIYYAEIIMISMSYGKETHVHAWMDGWRVEVDIGE